MRSIDTNCILRYLLDDIPEQTALISDIIDSEEDIAIAEPAIIETVFVLEKVPKISRKTIEKAIMVIMRKKTIHCNRELFTEVFPIWSTHPKLSFVDCCLEVTARNTGNIPLLTFDKKLARQLDGAQTM